MDRVLSDLQPGLGTTAIVGELTLTKTGTTARTVTFPDAAITVAGLGLAQTWTADQTFDVIKTQHCDAATSAGVHIGNASHQDVAIFGAGGGQGTTFYGQINGTTQSMSGQITSTVATGSAPFVVASTTKVANLNVDYLNGTTWAAPGAIGGTTPAAGAFTTLTATTNIALTANAAGAYRSIDITNTNATGYAQINMYSGSLQSARNVAVGLFIRDYQNGTVPWEWVASSTTVLSLTAAGAATFASSVAAGGKFSVTSTATECDFFTGNNANGRQFEMGANVAGIGFLTVRNNTGTIGVNLNGEGSAAFGATGMSASERMRIAGGSAPGTPGSTEVLIGAGQIYAGAGISCTTLTASGVIASSKASAAANITDANSSLKLYDAALGAGLFGMQTSGSPYAFQLQVADSTMASKFPLQLNPLGGLIMIGSGGLAVNTTSLAGSEIARFYGGSAPGTPGSTEVLIGAGQIKAGAGISCTTLMQQGYFAAIHVHDASTAQTIATGATYTKSTAFTDNGFSANCTPDAANDKITITKTGLYRVEGTCSFTTNTNNVVVKGTVFLGGSEQDQIHWERKIGTASDIGNAGFTGIIDVTSANTDIDLRFAHDAGADITVTIKYANLNVSYLGET